MDNPAPSDKMHINSAKPHKTTKTAKPRKTAKSTAAPTTPTIKGVEVPFIPDDPTPGKWNGKLGTEDCDTDEPNETPKTSKAPRQKGKQQKQPASQGRKATRQLANRNTPQTRQSTQESTAGDVPSTVAAADPLDGQSLARETAKQDAHRRWRNEGIAERVAAFRDRMRGEYVAKHPKCKRRDAQEYAWTRAIAEFPPPGVEPIAVAVESPPMVDSADLEPVEQPVVLPIGDESADLGVSGLGDMPADWPQLPANAQLQVEIAWVTANRLRVRSGTGVDLSRALSPAPSYSALSWLETSILFPSKFADISVKATAQQDDEREHVRREKMAIEEIRGLLGEMLPGPPCPTCGRPTEPE